jgi:hypothetical protein
MIEDRDSGDGAEAQPHPVPAEPVQERSAELIPPVISEFQQVETRPPVLCDPPRPNPGGKFVRWIIVITLGGSLGLLLVLVAAYTRNFVNQDGAFTFGAGSRSQSSPLRLTNEAIEKELRQVIESQLSAFREGDYPAAYNYAAAGLKAQVTLPAFERMVKTSYPVIAQSRSAEFGVSLDNGREAVVNVSIKSRSGRAHEFQYILQREGTAWRIFGVREVRPEGTTA